MKPQSPESNNFREKQKRNSPSQRLRDLEASSVDMKRGEPLREFLEAVRGEAIDPETPVLELIGMLRSWVPTEEHMRMLCGVGMAAIFANAMRGNVRAGSYAMDRFLGQPDEPWQDKVAKMGLDDAKAVFLREAIQAGIPPEMARQLMESASDPELRREGEGRYEGLGG